MFLKTELASIQYINITKSTFSLPDAVFHYDIVRKLNSDAIASDAFVHHSCKILRYYVPPGDEATPLVYTILVM